MTGRNPEPTDGATDQFFSTVENSTALPPPRPELDFPVLLRPTEPNPPPSLEPDPTGPSKYRRSWTQRLMLAFNLSIAFSCFIAASAIWYANDQLSARKLVDISGRVTTPTNVSTADGSAEVPTGSDPSPGDLPNAVGTDAPENTFPAVVDRQAKNFLLTGSDNRSCIDPDSPYAGAFLGTESGEFGERSDTIMVLRVDPETNQAAVLSFPRDLWVSIYGSNRKSRINAAFDTQNPTKLINTIIANFYIPIDHYINVDFCAFKGIVEAVGGVGVPFEFAARDRNTGLNIEGPECHVFQGDEALAYVRSRHYQWFNPDTNQWVTDGTSDYGRITRQQDFLKRALSKAMDRGARNPLVAQDLLDTMKKNVETDTELTLNVMLELAGAMQNFDPTGVKTFQVEGRGVIKGNAQVIEPITDSDSMQKILAVFRGEARLADAPTATSPSDVATTLPGTTPAGSTTTIPAGTTAATSTSVPGDTTPTTVVVEVEDMRKGFFPPDDPSCR